MDRKEYKQAWKEQNKDYVKEKSKKYYNENKEHLKSYQETYRKEHKKERRELRKKYYVENKESSKNNMKEYYEKNKESINTYKKEWYEENKNHVKEYQKKYREQNKEKIKKRYLNKIKTDPIYALSIAVRKNILEAFRNRGFEKENKTTIILGCTFENFKKHLESQFEPWMTWENRGKYNGTFNFGWDIDHINPLSSAKTIEDVIKLNHYTNLQPLCSHINRDIKVNFV